MNIVSKTYAYFLNKNLATLGMWYKQTKINISTEESIKSNVLLEIIPVDTIQDDITWCSEQQTKYQKQKKSNVHKMSIWESSYKVYLVLHPHGMGIQKDLLHF